jgi:hypothetical protein
MWIRIQERQINVDPDPEHANQCGSGSGTSKSMLIRTRDRQINEDPFSDPEKIGLRTEPGDVRRCTVSGGCP